MNFWWILFAGVEILILGTLAISKIFHKPSSADVEIGETIGNGLLIGAAVLLALIAFTIFAWHHFRFAP
jgi:hypothetical protein